MGPVPVRAYALCILAGIVVALVITNHRWRARGGAPGVVLDIAMWAVPFGIVGGRIYHVVTDPELYFPPGRNPWNAFKIWEGGLGIWGAVALGAVGAWIGARRAGVPLSRFVDAAAPAIAVAQAFGRWGNWFNQELFGGPTSLPWGLEIDPAHRPAGYEQYATFQPTFLYESLWCLLLALLVVWADRRFHLSGGRAFALYVAAYTLGRGAIEYLRIDTANHVLGLRLNDWTSLIIFAAAVAYLVLASRNRPAPAPDPAPQAEEGSSGAHLGGSTRDGDGQLMGGTKGG